MRYKGYDIVTTAVYAINGRLTHYNVFIIAPNGDTMVTTSEAKARETVDVKVAAKAKGDVSNDEG